MTCACIMVTITVNLMRFNYCMWLVSELSENWMANDISCNVKAMIKYVKPYTFCSVHKDSVLIIVMFCWRN